MSLANLHGVHFILTSARSLCLWMMPFICVHCGAADGGISEFSKAETEKPPPPWKFVTLPNKKPTGFSVVGLDGAKVLKVEADDSYGNLVHVLKVQPTASANLSWRWRVDKLIDGADLLTRAGDDSPAKICVFFNFDASRLPMGERVKLLLVRSKSGEDVPAEALCYVWDNKLQVETGTVSAYTKRVRFIVLQSGADKLGQWIQQKREIGIDYRRLFGEESDGSIPEVTGVAVSADADNTHSHSLAYFGDIALTP